MDPKCYREVQAYASDRAPYHDIKREKQPKTYQFRVSRLPKTPTEQVSTGDVHGEQRSEAHLLYVRPSPGGPRMKVVLLRAAMDPKTVPASVVRQSPTPTKSVALAKAIMQFFELGFSCTLELVDIHDFLGCLFPRMKWNRLLVISCSILIWYYSLLCCLK
jgi:hypothetical protein